ncbi:MAG: hypothetical protein H2B00_01125 [Nitrosopumilaceae archaeon]|uniref:Uncharacterized protein n=3 Tax=Candidatus Nitrosomaritimum aestuariumsis TaxID=3342354 RepID=A0AC60WA57_9ARCH|nr:hypothetical protein [Nitrosopumilaceae archaeon]MBA4460205.1 hypothetical protein [Nitrosopumilaceae archaeon]MBA4461096.1 hypothetical protein [Nitrosopumilaceae archaeon]MBA4464035.1 hypothetical protein [Nitrosopumilaceae archaeon]
MKKILFGLFLILMLFPVSSGFSQKSDTLSTLSVVLTSETPFVYQDDEGYTIVVGNVENKNKITSVTNVQLVVNFYDDTGFEPIETVRGSTILELIPESGISPYVIKSSSPNPNITQVSIFLEGFSPSSSKSQQLKVESTSVVLDENLKISGVLTNGGSPITDTSVHIAFYDSFIPPRLVGVSSIPIGDIAANDKVDFYFNEAIDSRAVNFQIFAQSDVFYSNFITEDVPEQLTRLVTISNTSLKDSEGNRLAEINVGSTVNIQSDVWVQFSTDQATNETPYRYYAQVKESGDKPYVEFLGKFDGRFIGTGSQSIAIDWIPENSGVYFIETFVWDRSNIPIAQKGPIVLIIVN